MLKPKHWKALELIEEGLYSLKEVAEKSGISYPHLTNLVDGDIEGAGESAHLFQSEMRKILNRKSSKIHRLQKSTQERTLALLESQVQDLQKKRKLTKQEQNILIAINNSLAKSKPTIEIGSISYNRGLTKEELASEFKRLTSLANAALNDRPVRSFGQKGEGILPLPPGTRGIISEEQETDDVRPDSETGGLS